MIDRGKKMVIGIMVDAIDYEGALARILEAAREGRRFAVSALAVHGVMTGVQDSQHKYRLNSFDLIVPDGQPVRWALNLIHRARLADRVYGPELTLRTLKMAEEHGLPIYLYGTTSGMLENLTARLRQLYPKLVVAGSEPSKFRAIDALERQELSKRIVASGAKLVFVGLGCPRQEVFAYEMKQTLTMPLIAVGAAFAFIAGDLPQAPPALQRVGLEWLYRLKQEPHRLWRRYLLLNPYYVGLLVSQYLGYKFSTTGARPSTMTCPG